jgi:hypothetical protein
VFALLEHWVGDLALRADRVFRRAAITPVHLVVVGRWVVALKAFRRSSIASIWNLVVMKASGALALSVARRVVMTWYPGVICVLWSGHHHPVEASNAGSSNQYHCALVLLAPVTAGFHPHRPAAPRHLGGSQSPMKGVELTCAG